jgi:hypothetical protein
MEIETKKCLQWNLERETRAAYIEMLLRRRPDGSILKPSGCYRTMAATWLSGRFLGNIYSVLIGRKISFPCFLHIRSLPCQLCDVLMLNLLQFHVCESTFGMVILFKFYYVSLHSITLHHFLWIWNWKLYKWNKKSRREARKVFRSTRELEVQMANLDVVKNSKIMKNSEQNLFL